MSAGCLFPEPVRTSSEPSTDCRNPANAVIELEPDAVLYHVAFDEARHFRIERGHDLIELLDQRHFETAMDQVSTISRPMNPRRPPPHASASSSFESRIRIHFGIIRRTPSSHSRMLRASGTVLTRDSRKIDAGQRRADRRRPGRQHEFVVFSRWLPRRSRDS